MNPFLPYCNQSRSWDVSSFISRLGPDDNKEPMAMEALVRGEYSAESLRSDDEYGDGGNCSDECDAS